MRKPTSTKQKQKTAAVSSLQGCPKSVPAHLWQVQVDFITIKVSVEAGAVGVVHPDGPLTLQHTSPAGQSMAQHATVTVTCCNNLEQ